jgi:PelA/Pel-15E family pectate lyase
LKRLEIDSIQELSEAFKRYEVVGVSDQNAPPIWARYYEIESNRPFFCNRDGIKVYSLAEVGRERRIGYQWYGYWPQSILKEKYPQWLKSRTAKLRE